MNLTDPIVLIDEAGTRYPCKGKALVASAAETDEEGLQVPVGSIRIVIDRWSLVVPGWKVEFGEEQYKVEALTPYLKQQLPPRTVLSCSPGAY